MSWLTVEKAAYGGAVLLALALRLLLLDGHPLGPDEAAQALPALAAATGHEFDLVRSSPLLFGLQRILFVAFGAWDVWARWWPALLGGLAPLLYYWLRKPLSRGGALAAAYLWAISPMAVFVSRLGLGYGMVPPLALAVLAGTATAVSSPQGPAGSSMDGLAQRRLGSISAAGALGLLLASGSGAYTVLLIGLMAALMWRDSLSAPARVVKDSWKGILAAFALSLTVGATFFFAVPSGLAAAADLLGSWFQGLRPGAGEYGAWEILQRLMLSEPLLVGFGIAGLIMSLRTRDRFGIFAALAAGLALLIPLLGNGRHPADLGLVVVALTLLAGPVVARVLTAAWSRRGELDPVLLVGVSLILFLCAGLCLPGALNPANNASWRQLYAGIGIVAAGLALLLWVVYGVWGSWRTVGFALPLVPLVLGLAWGVGQVTGLNYDRGAWRQAGVLHELSAPAVVDLQAELGDLASLHGTGAGEASIDLVLPAGSRDSLEPALRWAIRHFPNARVVSGVSPAPAPIVITMPEDQPRLGSRYSGTEIAILQRWKPSSLADFYSRLRWLLYREVMTPPEAPGVVLWVQHSAQAQSVGDVGLNEGETQPGPGPSQQ